MPTTANSGSCTPCEWGFFSPQSRKDLSPLSETLSLRALQLSLLELANALLERVFPSTLFLSECRCVAVENLTRMNCGSK